MLKRLREDISQAAASPSPHLVEDGYTQMLLFGDRGAGKSSYINTVATAYSGVPQSCAPAGEGKKSYTLWEFHYPLPRDLQKVLMYDTPGETFEVQIHLVSEHHYGASCLRQAGPTASHRHAHSVHDGYRGCIGTSIIRAGIMSNQLHKAVRVIAMRRLHWVILES
jgi:hypothetical protein